ncbi:M23 family metallopeptidase [Silvimonas soli]|uniref:M23 family metallopeptidase n=1 Tax=Silvimonas soli TaxID=2980100 RepID=UPI0024B322EA|nr:M23 family metallopeptidase [Silvimonas soli]
MNYKNTVFDWPLDSNIIRRGLNANTFGMVRHDANGPRAHQGWDFFAPTGTPVYAVADGTVVFAGNRGDFGLLIVIEHPGTGIYSAYAHLSRIDRDRGRAVHLGDQIGLSGCSGNAAGMTGPDQHLHFEIRTQALPGLGLAGRISPLQVFGICPMCRPDLRGA